MLDLIIVGAGPSGSSAGRLAGKLGLETLLIEKESFPRHKPCGGALTEQAMSYLDFEVPARVRERNISGGRLHFGRRSVEFHSEDRIAVMVTRSVFDTYLLEKARETGIQIHMGERVVDCVEGQKAVQVFTDQEVYEAKFVIVAEGALGRLKHRIRRRDTANEYGVCVVAEIPEADETIDERINSVIDIHFGVVSMGYGWVFPHEKYYSVGIGGLANSLRSPRNAMVDFLKANGFDEKNKLRGHVIPVGGIRRNLVGSRVLLGGDAAGFVDSFTGEGIAYAIRSGQLAVEVIPKALSHGSGPSVLHEYELTCEKEFGANLRYSLVLAKLVHRFPGIFFKILTDNKDVIDNSLRIHSRERTYRSYVKWLIPRIPKYLLRG
jgi:geranylgeranyl reductase family protein